MDFRTEGYTECQTSRNWLSESTAVDPNPLTDAHRHNSNMSVACIPVGRRNDDDETSMVTV